MNAKKGIYNIVFGILGQALTVVFAIIVPKVIIEYYGSEAVSYTHLTLPTIA